MKTLVIIPARGGSKGIHGKNIKLLSGRPLIDYTIDVARSFTSDEHICVSTDSDDIIECVKANGLNVPFKRPLELASDTAHTYEVLLHAINFYETSGQFYDTILLMQPTSPFRKPFHLKEIQGLYSGSLDMVVSVGLSHHSPYFTLFEEDSNQLLRKCKESTVTRRQDLPPTYFYNGSLYLINVASLKAMPIHAFKKVKKYLMEDVYCQDIDTPLDWLICETMIREKFFVPEVD